MCPRFIISAGLSFLLSTTAMALAEHKKTPESSTSSSGGNAALKSNSGAFIGLSRDIQSEYSKLPPGLQHMPVETSKAGTSIGFRVRPMLSFSSDPQQRRIQQVWVGPALLYSY